MLMFYQAVLESLIKYGIQARYWNLHVLSKSKLAQLTKTAIMGREEHRFLQRKKSVLKGGQRVLDDSSHVTLRTSFYHQADGESSNVDDQSF